jgi:hypothetical protein
MTSESPDTMRKLRELARNLWWSWQPDIRAIFRELDPDVWKVVYHNPVALLQRVPDEEIARRVTDLEMQTRIDQAYRRLKQLAAAGVSSSPARRTRGTRAARRWRSGSRTWRRTRASPAASCSSRTTRCTWAGSSSRGWMTPACSRVLISRASETPLWFISSQIRRLPKIASP